MFFEKVISGIVDFLGYGFDPNGSTLPAWKTKPLPTAKLPKEEKETRKPNATEVDERFYTDAEIAQMSDLEFALKVGGVRTKADFFEGVKANAGRKNKTVEFDPDTVDVGILTPRELGELKAYPKPKLDNLELAVKVKIRRQQGKGPKEIAKELKEDYQTIRHYSSALHRAEKNP